MVLIIHEITLVKTLTPSNFFSFKHENLSLPNIMTRKMVIKLYYLFQLVFTIRLKCHDVVC